MLSSTQEGFQTDLADRLGALRADGLKIVIPAQCGSHRCRPGFELHPTSELFIQTGGATDFSCSDKKFRLSAGQVCVMPHGVPHREVPVDTETPYGILVCLYDRNGMFLHRAKAEADRRIVGYGTLHLAGVRCRDSFRYLDDIAAAHAMPAIHRKDFIRSLLEAFLLTTLTSLKLRSNLPAETGSTLIVEAERLISMRLGDHNLSVQDLARNLGCTPDHLSRQFHRERRITLINWIGTERVALAKDMLTDRRYNVTEVAWACGFKEPSYFIRIFRRHTGTTPRSFRKEAKPQSFVQINQ